MPALDVLQKIESIGVKAIRIASLPLLHRGDMLRNSPVLWFVILVLLVVGLVLLNGSPVLYLAIVFPLVVILFCISARIQRRKGLNILCCQCCPFCHNSIGAVTSAAGFGAYTRSSNQIIQRSKEAFSVELGQPLSFVCSRCDTHLFFDYLDTRTLSLVED